METEHTPIDVDSIAFQDEMYDVLASSSRRVVLQYLTLRRAPVSITRLADEIAAVEQGVFPEQVTDDQRHQALISLRHVDLPKLHAAGLIGWVPETEHVSMTSLLGQLSLAKPTTVGIPDASVPEHPKAG